MRFISIATEDEKTNEENPDKVNLEPNKTDEAIKAVENKDSTEPQKVIQVANYSEELAKIRAKNKEESSGEGDSNNDSDPANDDQDNSSEDENNDDQEDNSDDEDQEQNSENDDSSAQPEETSGSDEEVVATEAYFKHHLKQSLIGLEVITELSKYKDMVDRKAKVGGINQATAIVINNAMQSCADRAGYTFKEQLPALESYTGYTSNTLNTRQLSISLENFITTVWEAIKKFFKGIYNWILELLGIKKTNENKKTVCTKEERTKREEQAAKTIASLEEKLKKVDLARERDEKRDKKAIAEELSASIANHIFCSNDTGTFGEIAINGENIVNGIDACIRFIETVSANNNKNFPTIIQNFSEPPLQDYCIGKEVIGNLKVVNEAKGNNQSCYTFTCEEVVGGVGFEFVLSDPSVIKAKDASITVKQGFLKEIQKQSFGIAKVNTRNKKTDKKKIPLLDQNERSNLEKILHTIKQQNSKMEKMLNDVEEGAEKFKKIIEKGDPPNWTAQANNTRDYNEKVSYLKNLLMTAGFIYGSLGPSIVRINDMVKNFSTNFSKIDSLYA